MDLKQKWTYASNPSRLCVRFALEGLLKPGSLLKPLEASWKASGGLWKPMEKPLEASWKPLEASWMPLEASWVPLGSLLGAS